MTAEELLELALARMDVFQTTTTSKNAQAAFESGQFFALLSIATSLASIDHSLNEQRQIKSAWRGRMNAPLEGHHDAA
jgi:hypothetical protein